MYSYIESMTAAQFSWPIAFFGQKDKQQPDVRQKGFIVPLKSMTELIHR